MTIINLRDYYPFYTHDCFINVSEEVAALLKEYDIHEETYQRRARRYKAYYSLDRDNGIENSVLFTVQTPEELYERKLTMEQLYTALNQLPEIQRQRIYAFFFLGMSKTAIAKAEGVDEKAVRSAIDRGLRSMEKFLKNSL